ncbi:DMT family transporter [Desulfitibacter alkalitolerans]|uniref:DMT family transporter n=1 Tax=Desulfitibacter alkalitolerans TaxID=264641 RepID=UPI0004850ABE|nr:DMT family transporter [Desulfitibacter alkalitolerans]
MRKSNICSMFQAMLASVLFGASAPISKLLLGNIEPIPMAAFLYLGSGVGLLLFKIVRHMNHNFIEIEAKIDKGDIKWLIGAIIAGGVIAPIVLMFSLRNTPASTASLLLNFEGVATTLIAAIAFKEAIGRRIWLAIASITTASILLSLNLNGEWGLSIGALGVVLACTLWGIDNNFTRNISAKDPLITVTIKGIGAGVFSLILALIMHTSFPNIGTILGAMLLGCFSYGLSIVLFIFAMRNLGASRTSAFFGTAPFVGTLLSFLLFREFPSTLFYISLPIMIIGAILILGEEHGHIHIHESMEHEHRHNHNDGHHTHKHIDGEHLEHTHLHKHATIEHSHKHTPDTHHRHAH